MAVSEQTPYIEYTANGTTTGFALEFYCDNQDHLIVLVDDVEPAVGSWSLTGGAVVFGTAPEDGKRITIQRNTPFSRNTDYQSYNNSFRPQSVNGDFDRVWLKLQELGVTDWLLRLYIDRLHGEQKTYIDQKDTQLQNNINSLSTHVDQQDAQLQQNIDNLKIYVDDRDDELRAYLIEEIRKQGVALDQLDDYYNYLMQRLAQIAVDKGWDASFVVSADGSNQQQINDRIGNYWYEKPLGYPLNSRVMLDSGDIVKSTVPSNTANPNVDMTGWANETKELRELKKFNPKDFGAKFDGATNDSDAHIACANAIKSNGGGILVLPSGTSIIGKQTTDGPYLLTGEIIYDFNNLNGQVIVDWQRATLKMADGMYFGAFNSDLTPKAGQTADTVANQQYKCSVGMGFMFGKDVKLTMRGTGILDGNVANVIKGGGFGNTGIQVEGFGMSIFCDKTIVTDGLNIDVINWPLDSLYVGQYDYNIGDVSATKSIGGINCIGSARQGMSVVGGSNYKFTNMSFKDTGTINFSSLPRCGVDIETDLSPIENIEFNTCVFSGNTNFGYYDLAGDIRKITVKESSFYDTSQMCAHIFRTKFEYSDFHGRVGIGGSSAPTQDKILQINEHPTFNFCNFSDRKGMSALGSAAILNTLEAWFASGFIADFNDCAFEISKWFLIYYEDRPTLRKFTFNRCKFIIPSDSTVEGFIGSSKIFAYFDNDNLIDCEFIDQRTSGSQLKISVTNAGNIINPTITTVMPNSIVFNAGGGKYAPSVKQNLGETKQHLLLTKTSNLQSFADATNTAIIEFGNNVPISPVLRDNTMKWYGVGSIIFNSSFTGSNARFWQCIGAGYACSAGFSPIYNYPVNSYFAVSNRLYVVSAAGTTGSIAPTHTSGEVVNGTATIKYIGVAAIFNAYGAKAATVENATGTDDTSVKLNALLSSLRAANILS